MIWTLTRKELLANLLTLRLAVALAFTVALSVMTALIGSDEYSRNVDRFEAARREANRQLDEATTWQQVQPRLFLAPQPLWILCRGLSEGAAQSAFVELDFGIMSLNPLTGASSDLMQSLVRIDFVSVVSLLLSFLAVVLGYDGICGERERGTLELLLTNPVPRLQVVLGKLLGGLLSLWVPLALAFTAALLILLSNPDVQFAGDDWLRLALLFALSCLFLGQVLLFSLAVSVSTRSASTSLIVCLFFWLVAGVGWANVLPSLSRYGIDEPPFQEFVDQNQRLWKGVDADREAWEENHPPPDDLYFTGHEGEGVVRYFHPEAYDWLARRNAYMLPRRLETADRRQRLLVANWTPLAREGLLIDIWGVLSPLVNYQVLAYRLARTTLDDRLHEARAAQRYRDTYYDWLRGRGAFADRRWFTDDPAYQEPMVPDPESLSEAERQPDSPYMMARRAWMEEQQELADGDDARHLVLTDMPKFGVAGMQRGVGASLATMAAGLASLLGTSVVLAVWLLLRFATYDPGR